MPPRRRNDEDRLQIHCAAVLRRFCTKTVWFCVPNGGKRDKVTAARLRQMGVRSGVADFILLCRGQAYAIELKDAGNGVQSENQKGFQKVWEAAGGVYELVRTPHEFEALIFKYLFD